MLKLLLIRHGSTPGNLKGRYIGITDESLSDAGRVELENFRYEKPDLLFVSPLKRCRETAEILFPGQPQLIIQDLAEMNFGIFENKNYQELDDDDRYQAWVDSGCLDQIPQGESKDSFQKRILTGLTKAIDKCLDEQVSYAALAVHGGTIMAIMEKCEDSGEPFYHWHVKNGQSHVIYINEQQWRSGKHQWKMNLADDGETL